MVSDETLKNRAALYQKFGLEKAAEAIGIKHQTLDRQMRLAKQKGIFSTALPEKQKFLNQIAQSYSTEELRSIAKGNSLNLENPEKTNINFNGKSVKVGVITHTHIGHTKSDPNRIFAAFQEFKKEKVDFVCHVGDVTEGMSHRPGHIYELSHLGYERQKQAAIDIFSQWTDTPIYAIDGNHDRWYIKSNGAIIVKDISRELENFNFIGHDEGDIMLNDNVSIRLWHGEDGNSYALSYRIQKILESLQGGDKPNVMFCGHTHKYVKLFERNVHAVSVGCIEDQTKWMRGKKIAAHTGFDISEITFNENGVTRFKDTWYPFY